MKDVEHYIPSHYPNAPLSKDKEEFLRQMANKPVLKHVERPTELPPAPPEPIDTVRDKIVARLEILRSMRDTCYFCLTESIEVDDIILYSTQVNFLLNRGAIKDRNKGTGRPPRYVLTGRVEVESLEDECRKKMAINKEWKALPKISNGHKTAAHRGRAVISLDILKIVIETGKICMPDIAKKDRAAYMRQARRLGMDGVLRLLARTLVRGPHIFVPVSKQAVLAAQEDLISDVQNDAL